TAGRHRRFLRSSLEAMTSAPRRTRYGTGQLTDASTTIIGDAHRRMQRTGYAGMPWQSRLSPEQREDFRRWGQRTFNLVIEYVAANKRSERELLLDEAEKMGALYGREALAAGLTLAEAIEAFLFYRSPVLDPRTPAAGHVDPRLDAERIAGAQRFGIAFNDVWLLVRLDADAVAGAMDEGVAVSTFGDQVAIGSVDLLRRNAGGNRGARCELGAPQHLIQAR